MDRVRRACGRARGSGRAGGRGFSLTELLLALALALPLCGLMLQALLAEGRNGERLVRLLRERALQRRILELVRADLRQADGVLTGADAAQAPACPLAGRRAVLRLRTAQGAITYSEGAAPSPIWRGRVLVRCGPAYGLHGEPSGGEAQSRVVIDALPALQGFTAEPQGPALLQLTLRQSFAEDPARVQRIETRLLAALPPEGAP